MIQNLLYVLILLAGFPIGWFLAKICKEEINNWRGRLFGIVVICFMLVIGVSFTNFLYKIPIIMSLFLTVIICLKIIWMSYR